MDQIVRAGRGNAGEAGSLVDQAKRVAASAAKRAAAKDADGAFPTEDIADLCLSGLIAAPFPPDFGGHNLGIGDPGRLRHILGVLGRGSLSLGRLYEGHVNAVVLVARYGTPANLALLKQEADAGRPSGVWMAGDTLRLERADHRKMLRGRKVLCSGAGHFRRPVVAADCDGGSVMVIPFLDRLDQSDAAGWTSHGMRATATGNVDFGGIAVEPNEIVGRPGDYLRAPYFRGGAWRVIAVQLGGLEAIVDHYKTQLGDSPHRDHPLQLARFGEAQIACETARLWVRQASMTAEGSFNDPDAVDAYVDLARNAFEAAALQVIALAQKAIGLKAFLRPNPMERIIRDLATYLRQPALDMSLISAATFHLRKCP